MNRFTTMTSQVVFIPFSDIDTDQIIPARYLKTTVKMGLGDHLFADWRYLPNGRPNPDFVLNRPEARRAQILLAGDNFGCGSSREHAPWALLDWGFRAVLSTSFADIFRNNALKNGLLPVVLSRAAHDRLGSLLRADASAEMEIDLPSQEVRFPDGSVEVFPIDDFSKGCLLKGIDQMEYLIGLEDRIAAYEAEHDLI